jgi:hypothetical protein
MKFFIQNIPGYNKTGNEEKHVPVSDWKKRWKYHPAQG